MRIHKFLKSQKGIYSSISQSCTQFCSSSKRKHPRFWHSWICLDSETLSIFSLSWACGWLQTWWKNTSNSQNNHLLLDINCSFLSFCFDTWWPSKLTSTVFWCVRIKTESSGFFVGDSEQAIEVIAWTKCLGDSVFPPKQKHGGP